MLTIGLLFRAKLENLIRLAKFLNIEYEDKNSFDLSIDIMRKISLEREEDRRKRNEKIAEQYNLPTV